MGQRVHGPVPDPLARRILAQIVVVLPIAGRPDRARYEAAAAVGADMVQHPVDAVGAKGALVAADAGVERFRRQWFVAVFAGGSEL